MPFYAEKYAICEFCQNMRSHMQSHICIRAASLIDDCVHVNNAKTVEVMDDFGVCILFKFLVLLGIPWVMNQFLHLI